MPASAAFTVPMASTIPSAAARATRLPGHILRRYAIGSVATGGFATLPGLVLVYYLTDTLGVGVLLAGSAVVVAKIWDMLIDPVVGALSDRDLATHGSRRRLMLAGSAILPVCFVLTFAVPPGVTGALAGAWVILAFMLAATGFSFFQVPYITLPAEITADYDERTRLLAWRVVVLAAAILLFGAGGPLLREAGGGGHRGYLVMAIAAALALLAGTLVATRSAPVGGTRPIAAPGHGSLRVAAGQHYRAAGAALAASPAFRALLGAYLLQAIATGEMLAAASYVATYVLHAESAVTLLFVALIAPALPCAPLWGLLAQRIGKERAYFIASVLFMVGALSLVGLLWYPGAWLYASMAACGVGYAAMQALPMAMLPDVISADAKAHGRERAGVFGGAWTAVETAGFALGAGVLAGVLAVTGYRAHAVGTAVPQPPAATLGIAIAFSVVPALLVAASLIPLMRYRLRREDIHA